jgi:DNA-binding NarL/FixJ family response regulator
MRAIIVDDDPGFARILERRLKGFAPSLEVVLFDHLEAVRVFLRSNRNPYFELVVLDQHLPDGNGVEFLKEGWFQDLAVLVMSSDDSPDVAGRSLGAGASYFLHKKMVTEALFLPLVRGLLERNRLQAEVSENKLKLAALDTVTTLVSTLRHEINNPLGAVLGAAYLLKSKSSTEEDQNKAANLVESSGKRIKEVLDKLCKAVSLDSESKAGHLVFRVPGDASWDKERKK